MVRERPRRLSLSVAIPTYNRNRVLIDTLGHVLVQLGADHELLVVDQTRTHDAETTTALSELDRRGAIRWIRLAAPSITRAMNLALTEARGEVVLFLDDDIVPEPGLVAAHLAAHARGDCAVVAGRVLQPWHAGQDLAADAPFHFASPRPAWIDEFMGGNVSLRRDVGLALGGFDENFVRVAYRFEAELAHRLRHAGHRIRYEPAACIRHLKIASGGTRSFGEHLRSARPDHAVGAYYFLLRTRSGVGCIGEFLLRPARAVMTRHHLRRPWWILPTLVAELTAMAWACRLAAAGPRTLGSAEGGGAA